MEKSKLAVSANAPGELVELLKRDDLDAAQLMGLVRFVTQKRGVTLETSWLLKQLNVQLELYQEVADPLSSETAALVLAELRTRFANCTTVREKKDLVREAVRLSRALRRAVAEWQADRV